jgi:hypothetical protein
MRMKPLALGLLSGLLAWGLTALIFASLCAASGIDAPMVALLRLAHAW